VYVTGGEAQWIDFLNYYVITAVGASVVLIVIFVLIPATRRSGDLE
jgi:hypothetical protein